MRSTVEITGVVCPRCGEEYGAWYSPEPATPAAATCPSCGFDSASDPGLREDGVWMIEPSDDEHGET